MREQDWADADDPIEALHEVRRKLLEEAGGTIDAYLKKIMEDQKTHPENLVDFSKSARPQRAKAARSKSLRKPAKAKAGAKTSARKPRTPRKAVAL